MSKYNIQLCRSRITADLDTQLQQAVPAPATGGSPAHYLSMLRESDDVYHLIEMTIPASNWITATAESLKRTLCIVKNQHDESIAQLVLPSTAQRADHFLKSISRFKAQLNCNKFAADNWCSLMTNKFTVFYTYQLLLIR